MKGKYIYGMKYRGIAPGCQPSDFVDWMDDPTGKYYSLVGYDRPLTAKELSDYELEQVE